MGLNGREITILENGKDVLAGYGDYVKLEMEDNVALNIASNFDKQLMGEGSGAADSLATLTSLVGTIAKQDKLARATFRNSMMSARIWSGSNPISINLSMTFHVGVKGRYDSKMQVYEPMMKLARLPLPWVDESDFLIAPGTVAGDILVSAAAKTLKGVFDYDADISLQSTIYSLSIGNILYLPWVIIERAEPTFGKQMAKAGDGKFYPIHGTIDMTVSTLRAGSRDMLNPPSGGEVNRITRSRDLSAASEDAAAAGGS